MVTPDQGDIYLARLNPVEGHEQGGTRPIIVLQNNTLNKILSTVIIVPITSNLDARGKLTTYFLSAKHSKLIKDSVILLFQIRSIDKSRLVKRVATLKPETFNEILNQLKLVF